jgi:hypothetical protein
LSEFFSTEDQLKAMMNERIDTAIRMAKRSERIHPAFTLDGKGRDMLMTKLLNRWQKTEVERRDEVVAICITNYIVGFQYGFDAAVEAMQEYQDRRKYV